MQTYLQVRLSRYMTYILFVRHGYSVELKVPTTMLITRRTKLEAFAALRHRQVLSSSFATTQKGKVSTLGIAPIAHASCTSCMRPGLVLNL